MGDVLLGRESSFKTQTHPGQSWPQARQAQGRGNGGQPPWEVQEVLPDFSFSMWEPLAGWGRGRWQCWGGEAALGAVVGLPCGTCSAFPRAGLQVGAPAGAAGAQGELCQLRTRSACSKLPSKIIGWLVMRDH